LRLHNWRHLHGCNQQFCFSTLEQEEDEVFRPHSETLLKLLWIQILQVLGCGGLLWTRQWAIGFRKMLRNAWVAERLAASQDGLRSIELVSWLWNDSLISEVPWFKAFVFVLWS
jgi:hypothetical protein